MKKSLEKLDFLFIVAFIVAFLVLGISKVDQSVNTGWHDTGQYLKNAIDIKYSGGLIGFIIHCYSGTYTEANQHPLYLLILSLFAKKELSFFVTAKLISLFFGLLTIISLYLIVFNLYSRKVAVLSTLMMSLNFYFLRESSHVAAETVLVFTSLWAYFFIIKGFKNHKYWVLAGFFSGLAYFSKGSGIFMLAVFLISLILIYPKNFFKKKYAYLFFVLFISASAPLLWRNSLIYHNPIYNLNSHVMWLDNWEQTYNPAYVADPPNAWVYFKTHSPSVFFNRLYKGIKTEIFVTFDSLTMIGYLRWTYVGILVSFFLMIGYLFDKRKINKTVNFLFLALFLLFFSWYNAIVVDVRFILPVVPVMIMLSSLGMIKVFDNILKLLKVRNLRVIRNGGYAFLLILVFTIPLQSIYSKGLKSPEYSYKLAPGYEELLNWLKGHLTKNDHYILWPAHQYWFDWYAGLPGQSIALPNVKNFQAFQDFIRNQNITKVVIHKENLQRRKNILKEYFSYNKIKGVLQLKPIHNWQLIYKSRQEPVPFLIFKIVRNN